GAQRAAGPAYRALAGAVRRSGRAPAAADVPEPVPAGAVPADAAPAGTLPAGALPAGAGPGPAPPAGGAPRPPPGPAPARRRPPPGCPEPFRRQGGRQRGPGVPEPSGPLPPGRARNAIARPGRSVISTSTQGRASQCAISSSAFTVHTAVLIPRLRHSASTPVRASRRCTTAQPLPAARTR